MHIKLYTKAPYPHQQVFGGQQRKTAIGSMSPQKKDRWAHLIHDSFNINSNVSLIYFVISSYILGFTFRTEKADQESSG